MIQQLTTKNLNRASTSADVPVYPVTLANAVKVTTENGKEKNLQEVIEYNDNNPALIRLIFEGDSLDLMTIKNFDPAMLENIMYGTPFILPNTGIASLDPIDKKTEIINLGKILVKDLQAQPERVDFRIYDRSNEEIYADVNIFKNGDVYMLSDSENFRVLGVNTSGTYRVYRME